MKWLLTQNGEVRMVMKDICIGSDVKIKETMALLKILARGNRQIEEGRVQTADLVFERIRARQGNDK